MLGGRLDGARADRQPLSAEGGVIHARRIGGEITPLHPQHLRRRGIGRLGRAERCQPGLGAMLQQVDAPGLGPDAGCVGIVAEQCPRHRPDVLRGVPVIDDVDPLCAEVLGGQLPDPVRAITQDHDRSQVGLRRSDEAQAGISGGWLGPIHYLESPASGGFGQEQWAELAHWGASSSLAGRHKDGWARRRVRVWQPVAHLAAGDLADLGLVPAVLEAHLHPVYLGHQQLGCRVHWLSCLLSLGYRGRRGALALGERATHLLSVGAHGLNPEANASQALQSLRCLLEWQLGAGLGYPRLQLSTQDLMGTQAEHLVGRDPATFTRWTPVVRSLEWRVTAHTDWLPLPPLVWPTPGTTLGTGRTLALSRWLIQA